MNYKTFKTDLCNKILTVTFDNPPVNIQDEFMINDLIKLCDELNKNDEVNVVIFDSNNENFFIAHSDIDMLKNLSTTPVLLNEAKLSNLQIALQKVNSLRQATIAKIEGYARGGGHEFCLACDMRFALKDKAIFMQMEVGMGVLPCGGGASRIAKHIGLSKALEFVLSARDYDADEAYEIGLVNNVFDKSGLDNYVNNLAARISKFPLESINSCKKTIYKSMDLSIEDSLLYEAYQLQQALSKTPAIKRFTYASDTNFQNILSNQINFETELIKLQEIK